MAKTDGNNGDGWVELLGWNPWRVGRKNKCRMFDDCDQLLGTMERPELAAMVVEWANTHANGRSAVPK